MAPQMRIKLKDLEHLPRIDKAIIHSAEGSLYFLSVVVNGQARFVQGKHGQLLSSRNKMLLQMCLEGLPVGQVLLRHSSAYDEMIGQPPKRESNALEVPLANTGIFAPEP